MSKKRYPKCCKKGWGGSIVTRPNILQIYRTIIHRSTDFEDMIDILKDSVVNRGRDSNLRGHSEKKNYQQLTFDPELYTFFWRNRFV